MNKIFEKLVYGLKGYYPVKIGEQEFRGDNAHMFFWRIVNHGGFEPEFYRILDRYLDKNTVYCDIGAWIGPTAMYASRICKTVHAFEPDEIAYRFLRTNIDKNNLNNIITHQTAISTENGYIKMASHGKKPGDSMSSMVNIDRYKKSFRARAITWKSFIETHHPGKIDFIKMDIEGGEFAVIPSMKRYLETYQPMLHLSLHPAYIQNNERESRVRSLFSDLAFYPIILDESLSETKPADILANQRTMENFRSFLFLS